MSDYEDYADAPDYQEDGSDDDVDIIDEKLRDFLGGSDSDSDENSDSSSSSSDEDEDAENHDIGSDDDNEFMNFNLDNTRNRQENSDDVLLNHPSVDEACVASLHFNFPSAKLIKSIGHHLVTDTTSGGDERGINYNALGPVNDNVACVTCGLSSGKCQGHFGYIKLPIPVPDPFHGKKIIAILNCVCMECMECIADTGLLKTVKKMPSFKRLKFMSDKCAQVRKRKSEKCPHCQLPLPQIRKVRKGDKDKSRGDNYVFVLNIDDQEVIQDLKPQKVHMILKALDKRPVKKLLGLDRVNIDNLMMKYLLVLPTIARPNCETRDRQCEDDLTQLYQTILKITIKLGDLMKGKVPTTKKVVDIETMIGEEYKKLRFNIDALMHNKGNFAKNVSGRALKSLRQRLKGKKGQMRNNVSGKRVEQAMRTVISAGPELRMDEVGIPRYLARKVTTPERVNEINYDFLAKLFYGIELPTPVCMQKKAPKQVELEKMINCVIREDHRIDPDNLPKYFAFQIGDKITVPMEKIELFNAKDIIRDSTNVVCVKDINYLIVEKLLRNGDIISIDRCEGKFYTKNPPKYFKLQIGDVCERQLMDGDTICLNRQPSLHKTSILGKKARIHEYFTIRFNLESTTPLNADFDGDETAAYPSQDLATKAEMSELVGVANNLNSEQNSRPTMTIVQNALMGSYELTHDNPIIPRHDFMDCLMAGNVDHMWESLQRRAKIHGLDPHCGRVLLSSVFPEDFTYERGNVIFEDGIFLSGVMDKSTRTGILQYLQHYYSKFDVVDFMSNFYFLVYRWMEGGLYSVGLSDCDLPAIVASDIAEVLSTVNDKVQAVRSQRVFHDQKMQENFVENKICTELNDVRNDCQIRAVKAIAEENRFNIMLKSGSKGDFINHTQIVVCLGQQNFNGKRMAYELDNNTRTLPCFTSNSTDPASRGFVTSSFISGLSLPEFFFHMKGGREGLMDTATKTSETGYLQRRLIKTMEDLSSKYDGTVRGANNSVVSFLYGSANMDPARLFISQGKPVFCDISNFANMNNRKYVAPKICEKIEITPMNDIMVNPTLYKSIPELKKMKMKKEVKVLESKITTLKACYKRVKIDYEKSRKSDKKVKLEQEKALRKQQQKALRLRMKDIKYTITKWKGTK